MNKSLKSHDRQGEFGIQAFLYVAIMTLGYRIKGEVQSTKIFSDNKIKNCRFDLVVFDNDWKPLEIIETKDPTYSIPFANSVQYRRYSSYGVPVRFAKSMRCAFELMDYYQNNQSRYEILYGLDDTHENISNFMGLLHR